MDYKDIIAKRIAKEFTTGMFINLGVGIPTLVSNYIPEGIDIWLESENGICGLGKRPAKEQETRYLLDASKNFTTIKSGGSVFDSATSFGLIRGGHLDYTVLGAFQVDSLGNIANWRVPGGKLAGMGGAMDLVTGAKKVIVAMEHTSKDGSSKIVEKCNLPLTGLHCVDMIVTELAVILVTDKGLLLKEKNPEVSIEEIIEKTNAKLILSENITDMTL